MRTLTASERIERAYVTLELRPGVLPDEALQQYRRLVKRWHPDLYANDPQGQAEASRRMRQINAAFAVIRPSLRPPVPPTPQSRSSSGRATPRAAPSTAETAPREPPPFGSRLRPEDVDSIVEAMRGPSMFERFFAYLARCTVLFWGVILLAAGSHRMKVFSALLGAMLIVAGAASALDIPLVPARWRRRLPRAWYNK